MYHMGPSTAVVIRSSEVSSHSWEVANVQYKRKNLWCYSLCPLLGSGPLLGGSVIGGSTVYEYMCVRITFGAFVFNVSAFEFPWCKRLRHEINPICVNDILLSKLYYISVFHSDTYFNKLSKGSLSAPPEVWFPIETMQQYVSCPIRWTRST